jgi:cytochrome P450
MSTAALAAQPLPPGPKGLSALGSLFRLRRDPIAFFETIAGRYGDVVHYRIGRERIYLLRRPEHIQEVLVTRQHDFLKGRGLEWAKRFLGEGLLTSEAPLHTRQRRLSQPAFHRARIAAYAGVMVEYAARASQRWSDGAVIDLTPEISALTLAIAGKTLFDSDVGGEAQRIGESLTAIMRLFPRFTLPFAGLIHRLPLPSNWRFRRACAHLDATIYRLIAERRRSGADHGDLLSMLVAARDEEDDGGRMSDVQLRDELMTLLLAGHETTANALTWTFYLLSQHPEAEAALHAELDAVAGKRSAGFQDLQRLSWTEAVFAEAMRLYPPAPMLGRRALRDVPIGGYTIPARGIVLVSPWLTQRDARLFPDPLRFDPGRWTPEARASRHKFAYFPFGGGARQCIGESFAWMEGVLVLATLAQRFRLRLVPGHRVEPQALMTLRPRYGMRMRLERR